MNFRMNKIVWIPLLLRFYASGLWLYFWPLYLNMLLIYTENTFMCFIQGQISQEISAAPVIGVLHNRTYTLSTANLITVHNWIPVV